MVLLNFAAPTRAQAMRLPNCWLKTCRSAAIQRLTIWGSREGDGMTLRSMAMTLGLRWSRYAPAYAEDNGISNYVPRLYDGRNPLSGLVRADEAGKADL